MIIVHFILYLWIKNCNNRDININSLKKCILRIFILVLVNAETNSENNSFLYLFTIEDSKYLQILSIFFLLVEVYIWVFLCKRTIK